MTTDAEDIWDYMGISDHFRGGDGWRTIAVAEMRYIRYIRDGETGRWRRRKRWRHSTVDRINRDREEQ